MRHIKYLIGIGLATLALGLTPEAARAQDALGAGNALDANLSTLGRGNTASPRIDYRQRNLLVTGNVAGGRGFRDDSAVLGQFNINGVGYSAARDFRGGLAEDTLFEFNAGSALSSLNLVRYGSTFQSLRFGQELNALEYRRSGAGVELSNTMASSLLQSDTAALQSRLDQITREREDLIFGQQLGAARPIGFSQDAAGGELMLSASSLRGIRATAIEGTDAGLLLSPFDEARLTEDKQAGRALPSGALPGISQLLNRVDNQRLDQAVESSSAYSSDDDEYLNVLRRIADRYAGVEGGQHELGAEVLQGLDEQFKELRERLAGRNRARQAEPTPDETPDETPVTTDPGTEPDSDPTPTLLEGIAKYGVILRHDTELEHYAADRDDRFNELMKTAEVRLQEGEFFFAEQRFNRALRLIPDHPLALAGIAHAQIGAGLYLPSAHSLRHMFTRHPEMIDVRYAATMLPPADRFERVVRELRERLDANIEMAAHGFLLAYVGHLQDDRSLVDEGLEHLVAAPGNDEFVALLRSVWLAD